MELQQVRVSSRKIRDFLRNFLYSVLSFPKRCLNGEENHFDVIVVPCFASFYCCIKPDRKKLSPVTYIPGSKIVNHYVVSDTNYPVEISISSEPFSHIYTTSVINNEFDLILDFPAEEFIPPGSYTIGLKAAEMPSGSMGR